MTDRNLITYHLLPLFLFLSIRQKGIRIVGFCDRIQNSIRCIQQSHAIHNFKAESQSITTQLYKCTTEFFNIFSSGIDLPENNEEINGMMKKKLQLKNRAFDSPSILIVQNKLFDVQTISRPYKQSIQISYFSLPLSKLKLHSKLFFF